MSDRTHLLCMFGLSDPLWELREIEMYLPLPSPYLRKWSRWRSFTFCSEKWDLAYLVIARGPVGTMTGRRRIVCNSRNLTSTNSISTKTRDCRVTARRGRRAAPRNDKSSDVHFRPAWCKSDHNVCSRNCSKPTSLAACNEMDVCRV